MFYTLSKEIDDEIFYASDNEWWSTGDWKYQDQRGLLSHLVPSDGSFSVGQSTDSVAEDDEKETRSTWNDGIFLIDRAYGIDS